MPVFSIEEAKAFHCGQMVRVLREEHKSVLVKLGLNAHRQIRTCFDDSAFRRAWFIDGKLAGLGGVTGPMGSSSGMIWLALSQDATAYPKAILKEARKQLSEIMITKRALATTIIAADDTSKRFAERLGFTVCGPVTDFAIAMEYRSSLKEAA